MSGSRENIGCVTGVTATTATAVVKADTLAVSSFRSAAFYSAACEVALIFSISSVVRGSAKAEASAMRATSIVAFPLLQDVTPNIASQAIQDRVVKGVVGDV
jgi:hypothetical protein